MIDTTSLAEPMATILQTFAGVNAIRRSEAASLLNGTPWLASVECDADLEAVESWINQGIEAGVLSPERVELTGDDVIVDVAGGLINFTGASHGAPNLAALIRPEPIRSVTPTERPGQ